MRRIVALSLLVLLVGACAHLDLAPAREHDGADRSPDAEIWYQRALALINAPEADQDYATANRYLEQAAEQGHTKAQYFLGMAHYTGRGTRQSYPRARYWLEQAAVSGDANAQYHLGDIYLNGWGVKADAAWAAMWFGRAAQQGKAAAQFSLGVCYASGLGVPRQPLRARAWLRLAASQDYPDARALAEKLVKEAPGIPPPLVTGEDGWSTPPVITYVQTTLTSLGYAPGPVDGVWGQRTATALASFLGVSGDEAEITVTPEVLDALRRASGTLPSPFIDTLRRWFS